MWEPRRLTNLWASTACYRDSFTFFLRESIACHSRSSYPFSVFFTSKLYNHIVRRTNLYIKSHIRNTTLSCTAFFYWWFSLEFHGFLSVIHVHVIQAEIFRSYRSRDSAVGIVTGYGLDDGGFGVRGPVGSRIFSSPSRADRLWGLPNLLPNGYRGFFPRGGGKAAGAWSWPLTSD
jgi:hypothetical protein